MKYEVITGHTDQKFDTIEAAKRFLKKYTEGQIVEIWDEQYRFVRYTMTNGRLRRL